MEYLPEDPYILVSAINFLLRDEIYTSLDKICYDYNVDRKEMEDKLEKYGFHYDEKLKKFW